MNVDFPPRKVPHSLMEVGGVDSSVWQLTLYPHGDKQITLPTKGSMTAVFAAAEEYMAEHLPGFNL
jgi:hypothetical protein